MSKLTTVTDLTVHYTVDAPISGVKSVVRSFGSEARTARKAGRAERIEALRLARAEAKALKEAEVERIRIEAAKQVLGEVQRPARVRGAQQTV